MRQQWLVVVLLAALGLGLAAGYTFLSTPQYSASTQMFVSVRSTSNSITQLTQGSDFTQNRVKSYADVVTAPAVLNEVISDLGLSVTAGELADNVAVDIPPDTVLINVSVRNPSAARAAEIANGIAKAFPDFVSVLETQNGDARSPVKVSVTVPATAPTAPISPRVSLNLALGLLLGLALGVGGAILRKQSNTSVSGVPDIEKITGAIPLGVVPFDANTNQQPLVDADQHSPRAEAFRTLRTNLQFADVDNPPRVIVVTSALPAEGKSTSACNVALTLALGGSRVVLVDGDLRQPAIGRYLGIEGGVGLTNVLAGQYELRDVLVSYGRENLAVLPSGPTPPNPSELLGSKQMMDLLITLTNHYDIVVIDAPPLLPVTDAAVLSAAADGALLVVRHGKTRVEEVQRSVQTLGAVNAKLLGTVLNFAPKKSRGGGYDGYGYGYGYGNTATSTYVVPTKGQGLSAAAPAPAVPAPASVAPAPVAPAPPVRQPEAPIAPQHANANAPVNGYPAPTNGYAPNGHEPNGHEPNGHEPNGYAPNGYEPNGYAPSPATPANGQANDHDAAPSYEQPNGQQNEPPYGPPRADDTAGFPEPAVADASRAKGRAARKPPRRLRRS